MSVCGMKWRFRCRSNASPSGPSRAESIAPICYSMRDVKESLRNLPTATFSCKSTESTMNIIEIEKEEEEVVLLSRLLLEGGGGDRWGILIIV